MCKRTALSHLHIASEEKIGVMTLGVSAFALEDHSPVKKCILVVDDEEDIRDALQSLLESEYPGSSVLTAGTALEAIEVLKRRRVDLVITDYRMPGMDGLEFLDRVKQQTPRTRRGLITAFEPQSDRNEVLKGLDFFLRKPIHIDVFIEATDRSLSHPE
jgi:CheY-like chemotaxis protein